jgi:hypothetical protein
MPVGYRFEGRDGTCFFEDMEEDDLARAREKRRTVFIFFLAPNGNTGK